MDEFITVGKIGATYGVQGWLKIQSFTDPITNIMDMNPWYVEEKNQWRAVNISDTRSHGKGIIAKFVGYNAPETARILTGKNIAVKKAQLPQLDKNEFYWKDLEGCTVINQHNEILGTILYFIATGSNDVFVIKHGDREYAIPFIRETVITAVDMKNRTVHVNWDLL